MKPKKYEDIKYITQDYKRDTKILTITIIVVAIIGIIACINAMKVAVECENLKRENNELVKANEIKDSIISDLQEDNIKLQEMIK